MATISRRALLATGGLIGAAGVGIGAGFTASVHHKVAAPPPPPPAALTSALAAQGQLLAGYDAALADGPAVLPALRADIAEHSQAIRALLEDYPGWRLASESSAAAGVDATGAAPGQPTPSQPSAAPVAGTVAALITASKRLATSLAAAAVDWPASDTRAQQVAPVLGSIAACLSSHVQVLS